MFRKLLKYDNRAVFKYWWIAAVIALFISVFGGLCIQVVNDWNPIYQFAQMLATLGIVFSVFGMMLFLVLTEVLILVRFYKHFFTDEGYLTFTLPVKKTTLLDSKLVMTLIFMLGSMLLFFLDIFIMLAVGIPEHVFAAETWNAISDFISEYFNATGGYGVVYIVSVVLIMIASVATQMLFIFLCITLAATITKKHKVLAAIGIYYGANMALSVVMQILIYGGMFTIIQIITELDRSALLASIAFICLGLLGIIIIVAAAFYQVELYLLDKRLNLE